MEHVRSVALSRHTAPNFVMLSGLELLQLRKLPDRSYRLFVELLAMADHATGRISTTYARLLGLLDFDQAPGAHTADKPTLRKLRTALESLVALQLVRIDRVKNEKAKGLFLRLTPRTGISAPATESDRRSDRPARRKKPEESTTCAQAPQQERQTEGQGVQEEFIPPSPPLSTGETPKEAAQPKRDTLFQREVKKALRGDRPTFGGGEQQAPQGGQTVAAAPLAPPVTARLRPIRSQQTDEGQSPAPEQQGTTGLHAPEYRIQKDKARSARAIGKTTAGQGTTEPAQGAANVVRLIPAHQLE